MRSVHIIISGKVQGVFFRATAKRVADELNLSGWVRNTSEDVEVRATGADEDIAQFIEWCHHGPERANVSSVAVSETAPGNYEGFSINR